MLTVNCQLFYLNDTLYKDETPTVAITNNSYMYGHGVFETLRTYSGRIFRLEEHVKRLMESAQAVQLVTNHTQDHVAAITQKYLEFSPYKENRIKIVLTETEFLIWYQPLVTRPEEWYQTGIPIVSTKLERTLPEAKHLNCIPSVLAQKYAQKHNVYETLMISNDDIVREGSYSNIFWIKDTKLYTPAHNILHGITAQVVMEIGLEFFSNIVHLDTNLIEVLEADECFITNTTSEILPVVQIDDVMIGNGRVGESTKVLMKKFKEVVV